MSQYLKGNYSVEGVPEPEPVPTDTTDEFEAKAIAKLGGSICFVSIKRDGEGKFIFKGDEDPARRAPGVPQDQ